MEKIEQLNYFQKRFKYTAESEFTYMPTSDWHLDNKKCRRDVIKKHIEYCIENNGFLSLHGDIGCLMQGRYDPRSSKSDLDSLFKSATYMDDVVGYTAEFLEPYIDYIVAISDGNHETSVNKRTETNFLRRVIKELKYKKPNDIQYMSYGGIIDFTFEHKSGGQIRTLRFGYHHGNWGGIISKGTQGVPRFASIMPDISVHYSGHTHDQWAIKHPQYRVKGNGEIKVVDQIHIKGGTFKEEFESMNGWATEKITMPKSIGTPFLKIRFKNSEMKRDVIFREF